MNSSAVRGDALATIAYGANWRQIVTGRDYFALFRSPSPLQHTWSLAIEEQFYLVWPLVVLALVRFRRPGEAARRILGASVVLAVASTLWSQFAYVRWGATRVYYGTDTRVASIAIGAALASTLALRGTAMVPRARRSLETIAIAAFVLLVVAFVRLSGSSTLLYHGGLFVCGFAVAIVIAAVVHPKRGLLHRLLSLRALCALGLISYGVYLWHWPLFVFLDSSRVHLTGWPLFAIQVAATLVVSIGSYRWIEQPIRRGTLRPRVKWPAVPVAATGVAVAIIASTAGTPAAQTITLPATSGGVLIVGNSLGINLGFALDRAGLAVSIHSVPGCSLIPGRVNVRSLETLDGTTRDCGPFDEWVHAQHPQFVLLMQTGLPGAATQITDNDTTVQVTSARYAQLYNDAVQQSIDTLASTGATVIVPSAPCEGTYQGMSASQLQQVNARIVKEDELLHEVVTRRRNRIHVISPDLRALICPHDYFQPNLGHVADARPDGVHFSPAGADVVATWLVRQVPSLGDARRSHKGLADDLFDRLHNGSVWCTYTSAGGPTQQRFVTVANCAVLATRTTPLKFGVLHVDRRPKQLADYARNYRAISCAATRAQYTAINDSRTY